MCYGWDQLVCAYHILLCSHQSPPHATMDAPRVICYYFVIAPSCRPRHPILYRYNSSFHFHHHHRRETYSDDSEALFISTLAHLTIFVSRLHIESSRTGPSLATRHSSHKSQLSITRAQRQQQVSIKAQNRLVLSTLSFRHSSDQVVNRSRHSVPLKSFRL